MAGHAVDFAELQLRDPDRILIAHAHRHQPRDFAEHGVIDAAAADEPPQPVDIKLGVARALIVDQPMDAVADGGAVPSGNPSGSNGGAASSSPMISANR